MFDCQIIKLKFDFKDDDIFELLLKEVAAVFLNEHPSVNSKMVDWKGEQIIAFQEDLREKVNATVSEKWFYTYVKNKPEKLPRIDILNLLSRYAGSDNWHQFVADNSVQRTKQRRGKIKWLLSSIVLIGLTSFLIYALKNRENEFNFCFVDADKKEAITNITIDVIVLNEKESPSYKKTDSLGCVKIVTRDDFVHFVAQSPYHKNDTIYRSVAGKNNNEVRLRTDDYALMLHYYGSGNVKDWKKRRVELGKLIAEDAIIFELLPGQLGVELYNKSGFINKLTTPTTSLQQLQVVETQYKDGRIFKLKFKTNER